jgi:hypothetical protein
VRQGWVCDVADFAKFGLLKRLAEPRLRLGVVWYLTNHAAPNPPLVSYLSRPQRYRAFDAALFDALLRIRATKGDAATLDDIEHGDVLPAGALYYSAPLATTSLARPARAAARDTWFQEALDRVAPCDLVFLDPDTGLLPPNRKSENRHGEEYATPAEALAFCARGQSVACVQFGSPGNFEPEPKLARQRLTTLRETFAPHGLPEPWGLWWGDGHKVGMLIAAAPRHASHLRRATEAILHDTHWGKKVTAL